MSIADSQVVNEQFIQLLTRQSFARLANVNVAASAVAAPSALTGVTLPLPAGQAIRIVSLTARIQDANLSTKLFVESAGVYILIQQGASSVFAACAPMQGAHRNVGSSIFFEYSSQELISFHDYVEVGGIPPGLAVEMTADMTNTDAVNVQQVTLGWNLLVEYYLLKASGHVGYP